MNMPDKKIKDKVKEFFEKEEELNAYQKKVSDLLLEAKKHKNEPVSFMRKNNRGELERVDFKEDNLWTEVFLMGTKKAGRATDYLKRKYPEVFKASEDETKMAEEFKEMGIKYFGVDNEKVRLSDIIRLIIKIVEEYK